MGSVTVATSGGTPVPDGHAATEPAAWASLAVSWSRTAAAPAAGTPGSPARGRSSGLVPRVVSRMRVGVIVTNRPSAAPASLGRNQPSTDRATSTSIVG